MIDKNQGRMGKNFSNYYSSIPGSSQRKQEFKTTDEVHVYDITVKWLKKSIPLNIDIDPNYELRKFKEYWSISPRKRPRSGVMGFKKWLKWSVKYQQWKQGGKS